MTTMGLVLDFIDERYEAEPDLDLTFGRAGAVVIDELNEYMSRVVGAFVYHQGTWWLQNRSSNAQLSVVAENGTQTTLPPGTSDPITVGSGRIRFRAGPSNYELGFELTDPPDAPDPASLDPGQIDQSTDAKPTQDFGIIPLNEEQRAMLASFARSWLADPLAEIHEVPPNAEVAHELGWSLKKLDRKLDYLCARLSSAGVQGLRGAKGGEASDRRRRLVEHVIQTQLITSDDLPS